MRKNRQRHGWLWVLFMVLGLGLIGSSAAWAGFHGWGGHCMYLHLTPQQVGQVFDLKQKFLNDTVSLRREMAVKRAEMAELCRAAKPDLDKIKAKQKELNALREQLQEKRLAFWMEMRQFCPKKPDGSLAVPPPGIGRGPDGPGW